ncbi:MAG: nitroreductase family deazaflavin-dependent oxidoreductase [bacterium]|nr:nitroreductase family deazaflavin-dependent oxidoreductase [bacterium]
MLFAKWAVALGIVYVVAGVGTSFLSAETADLHTTDARGGGLQTSVWVVDVTGDLWIRATDPEALWYARLRANPDVQLVRDGRRVPCRALIVDGFDDQVDEAMREKYGRADELIAWVRDPSEFVAIRLDPVRAADRWSEHYP